MTPDTPRVPPRPPAYALHVRNTLRAALARQRARPRGLLRFPASWDSGTPHSQSPVPDHYDWSGLEGPSWRTLFAAVRTRYSPKP